jgi:cytochrome c-type biogenesis protein CcmH/NrfG
MSTRLPLPSRAFDAQKGLSWLALAGAVGLFVAASSPPDFAAPAADVTSSPQAQMGHDLPALAQRLALRLEQGAGDAAEWALLARSWAAIGDRARADAAYERASVLDPGDPGLPAERAQQRVLAGEGAGSQAVRTLVEAALARDARYPLALALDGDAAYERGDLAQARVRWQAARAGIAGQDAEMSAALERRLSGLEAGTQGVLAAFGR